MKVADIFNAIAARQFSETATPEKAAAIFAGARALPDMVLDHPEDGCHARTHLICGLIFDHGITARKIWAFKKNYYGDFALPCWDEKHRADWLSAALPDGREVTWDMHVAAVITVTANGKAADMVIDPALFDKPVDVATWQRFIHASEGNTEIKPYGMPPDAAVRWNKGGDYTPSTPTTPATDAGARDWLLKWRECALPK